jgi:co-chaperonin GroES (HSP10)
MTGLIVPQQKRLTSEQVVDKVVKSAQSEFVNDIDIALPVDDLPEMCLWRILVTPVRQRAVSKGGIILAADTQDVQNWTHQMYKIAYVGPHVWSGKAYEAYAIKPEERPKVGEIWLVYPKHPERLKFDGVTYVMITDDALRGRVRPGTEHRYSFNGLEL